MLASLIRSTFILFQIVNLYLNTSIYYLTKALTWEGDPRLNQVLIKVG